MARTVCHLVGVIGNGGARRTAAFRKTVWWPFRTQKSKLLVFRAMLARYRRDVRRMEEAGERAQDGFAGLGGELPERPVLDRPVCVDTAVNTLAEILEGNPRGTLVARADLDSWLAPFTRPQRRDVGRDLAAWSEMYLAGMIFVDRGGESGRCHFVRRAAVSITGLLRPSTLVHVLANRGPAAELASRLVLAMPPALPKAWSEDSTDETARDAYRDLLDWLRALKFEEPDDDAAPQVLTLAPKAKAAWADFYNARRSEKVDDDGPLPAALSELESYAARFALVHHVVNRVARRESDLVPVSRESIDAGVVLSRWCSAETRRIHASLVGVQERRQSQLADFIRSRGGQCDTRDLMRSYSRRYATVAAADKALTDLVNSGLARWVNEPRKVSNHSARPEDLQPTADNADSWPARHPRRHHEPVPRTPP
jgi:Protein of unknown function (DUF3987)